MSGQLAHPPCVIIAKMMSDLGLADLITAGDTGWALFSMHLPETPDQALVVKDTPGRNFGRDHVTGITCEHYGIQVLARSAEDPATPFKKMKAILEYFDTEVLNESVVLEEDDVWYTYKVNAVHSAGPTVPAGNDGRRFFYSGNALASIEIEETGTGS